MEKRNVQLASMVKLNINGQLTENSKEISRYVAEFYEKLYSCDNKLSNAQSFLDSIKDDIKKISESSIEMCDQEISLNEISHCINKLKDNKSPGNDGLISEFYKFFQNELSPFLLFVFTEAIQQGYLPNSLRQGLITLLPKPNKDILFLENWRPITLINNDATFFANICRMIEELS